MRIKPEIKKMIMMNASSMIIFNYIGIFVNLYIWEKNKSIFDVAWFNLILFISWTIFFVIGAKLLSHYTNRLLIQGVAIGGAATFFLLSFLELDNRMLWISIIALPVGAMWGFYAIAQNITLSQLGKGGDFNSYFSLASIVGQTINVVNPLAFAIIIKLTGYYGSFLLMFLFVLFLLVVSFQIPSVTLANEEIPIFRDFSYSKVHTTKALKWLAPSFLPSGVFIMFQGLFALLFTFSVSQDKLIIALLNVMYTCCTIAAMQIYRKFKLKEHTWLIIGISFVSVGFLIVLFPYSPLLVISNILTTTGMFYFGTIWNTQHFAIISSDTTSVQQVRLFIWREMFLNFSRIAFLLLVLNVKDFDGFWFMSLMLLTVSCALLILFFAKKSMGAFRQEKSDS